MVSLLTCFSADGNGCVVTDGEADAARSCSSRLGPTADTGDDLTTEGSAGFAGTWKGSVAGSDGESVMFGIGNVASLKRRPLWQWSMECSDETPQQQRENRRVVFKRT
jgi:hypothetical protein